MKTLKRPILLALACLSLLFSSCGMVNNKPKHDPRFNPIIQQFAKDAAHFGVKVNTKNIKVSFRDINDSPKLLGIYNITSKSDPHSLGVCYKLKPKKKLGRVFYRLGMGHYYDERYIFINPSQEYTNFNELETTVYHELGHCILDKEHDDSEGSLVMSTTGANLDHERYFDLKYFFTGDRIRPNKYRVSSEPRRGSELIFKTEYMAFDKKVFYELYFNEETGEYTVIQE